MKHDYHDYIDKLVEPFFTIIICMFKMDISVLY